MLKKKNQKKRAFSPPGFKKKKKFLKNAEFWGEKILKKIWDFWEKVWGGGKKKKTIKINGVGGPKKGREWKKN